MLKTFERQDQLLDASDTLQRRKWCPLYNGRFWMKCISLRTVP